MRLSSDTNKHTMNECVFYFMEINRNIHIFYLFYDFQLGAVYSQHPTHLKIIGIKENDHCNCDSNISADLNHILLSCPLPDREGFEKYEYKYHQPRSYILLLHTFNHGPHKPP